MLKIEGVEVKFLDTLFVYREVTVNKLREVRVIKRISQFQLRIATGIHQSKISMIENGWVQPREDEKQRLAKVLGVRIEEVFPVTPSGSLGKEGNRVE